MRSNILQQQQSALGHIRLTNKEGKQKKPFKKDPPTTLPKLRHMQFFIGLKQLTSF